jgi:hypothetical protein
MVDYLKGLFYLNYGLESYIYNLKWSIFVVVILKYTQICSTILHGLKDGAMLKKGFLSVFIVFIFMGSPLYAAAESVDVVDEVVTWWEKYGKYWDDAVADTDTNEVVASSDN